MFNILKIFFNFNFLQSWIITQRWPWTWCNFYEFVLDEQIQDWETLFKSSIFEKCFNYIFSDNKRALELFRNFKYNSIKSSEIQELISILTWSDNIEKIRLVLSRLAPKDSNWEFLWKNDLNSFLKVIFCNKRGPDLVILRFTDHLSKKAMLILE